MEVGPMLFRRAICGACVTLLLSTVSPPARAGTLHVRAGDDLQAALHAAQPGDTILLEPGATFRGNFVLPVKTGNQVITVRSAADAALLPGDGQRITPAHAALLPKLESPNTLPALRTAAGAHHWRLLLLEFPATHLGYNDIIRIGDGSSAQTELSPRCPTPSSWTACTSTGTRSTARSAASL
jgi:hypothetical protein